MSKPESHADARGPPTPIFCINAFAWVSPRRPCESRVGGTVPVVPVVRT
jgi:hypothetical protein